MHQAFDALFQFHEHAVVHYADDFAFYFAARGIFFEALTQDRSKSCFRPSETRCFSLSNLRMTTSSFLIGLNDVGRMLDAAPAEIGEVQQAVDAAEIDERAVLGDVLHVALDLVAFVERSMS